MAVDGGQHTNHNKMNTHMTQVCSIQFDRIFFLQFQVNDSLVFLIADGSSIHCIDVCNSSDELLEGTYFKENM